MKRNMNELRKEKGKMAKKIITYLIDILIVIAILAVGLYGYKLVSNKALLNKSGETQKKLLVTVEFEKSKKELLEKIEVNQEVKDSSKNEYLGTVVKATPVSDSIITVSDNLSGKYVKTTTPEYGMRTIVIECDGVVTDTTVTAAGSEVRIGSTIGIRTSDYTIQGKVMGIEFEEEGE